MAAAAGLVAGGPPPNAAVQIQPGMQVQPFVLVDSSGNIVTPVKIDTSAADIQPLGTVAAGSTGQAADASHVHPYTGWLPPDNNLLAACGALDAVASTFLVSKGDQYMIKVPVRSPFTASTVWTIISIAGTGSTTGCYAGLLNSAGSVLTSSSDCATQFTSANVQSVALTTPQALTPASTPFVWVALLPNLSSVQPTFRTVATASSAISNLNLTAANYRAAVQGGGTLTSITTVTPSSNSASDLIWVGLS